MIDFNKHSVKEPHRKLLKLMLCVSLILIPFLFASAQEIDEYLIKSAFLFKAPVFMEWPPNASYLLPQNNFVIAIIGSDPFNGKLQLAIKASNIKLKNKNISIRTVTKVEEIGSSDIVFISNSEKYNLTKILNYVKDKPILTLSDTRVFIDKGVMINMYIENNALQFNVNLKSINESKIYVSSKLLVNANKVVK